MILHCEHHPHYPLKILCCFFTMFTLSPSHCFVFISLRFTSFSSTFVFSFFFWIMPFFCASHLFYCTHFPYIANNFPSHVLTFPSPCPSAAVTFPPSFSELPGNWWTPVAEWNTALLPSLLWANWWGERFRRLYSLAWATLWLSSPKGVSWQDAIAQPALRI